MKRVKTTLLALILGAFFLIGGRSSVLAKEIKIPDYSNYINDQAEVIDDEVEKKLNEELKEFNKGEISVLTTKTIKPLTIEEFGIKLADKWKVGKEGDNNGAILIFVVDDKRVRLEIGKGTEALITDAQAGEILDKYVVSAKEDGKWTEATENSVHAVMLKMGGDPSKIATPSAKTSTSDIIFWIIVISIGGIIIVFCVSTEECEGSGSIGGGFGSSGGGFGFGGGGFGGGGASR